MKSAAKLVGCWQKFLACGCRTEVPFSLLVLDQGLLPNSGTLPAFFAHAPSPSIQQRCVESFSRFDSLSLPPIPD